MPSASCFKFKIRYSVLISAVFLFSGCFRDKKKEIIVLERNDGKKFNLENIKSHKAAVFVFLSSDCPLSQSYALKISEMARKYSSNDILFLGVFPAKGTTIKDVDDFCKNYRLSIPVVLDPQKKLTSFLKAAITPQAIVMNSEAEILYSGRIDNWAASLGEKRQVITSFDLDEALKCIINNQEIKIKTTEPVGCLIE